MISEQTNQIRLAALVIGATIGAGAGFFSGGWTGAILGAAVGGFGLAVMISYVATLHDEIPIWSSPAGRIVGTTVLFVLLVALLLVLGGP